jgi:hypothetical protein
MLKDKADELNSPSPLWGGRFERSENGVGVYAPSLPPPEICFACAGKFRPPHKGEVEHIASTERD